MSIEALATPPKTTLADRLEAMVRPEFRLDVLVPAVGDPVLGTPACAVPGCVHSSRYAALCLAHLGRWKQAGRPARRAWAATADPAVTGHRPRQPCLVAECGFGQHRYQWCYKHSQAWQRAGRPPVDLWEPLVATAPAAACAIPGCTLWAELDAGWCRSHHARWRQHGRPPTAEFIAHCVSYGEDRFDFRPLPHTAGRRCPRRRSCIPATILAATRHRHRGRFPSSSCTNSKAATTSIGLPTHGSGC